MESTAAIDALSALASPARLDIFRRLVRAGPEGLRSGDVAEAIGAPANTTSTHLAILSRAGLTTARRDSRAVYYAADFAGLQALMGFLLEDCCDGRPEICQPVMALAEQACCESGRQA